MIVFQDLPAVVVFAGECTFAGGVVEQDRLDADAGTLSFDEAITLDSLLWDGISAEPRWTGARLTMDGVEYRVSRTGPIEVARAMPAGGSPSVNYQTLKFNLVGVLFAIPHVVIPPPPYDPCPPAPVLGLGRVSPRLWGNKEVEFFASFGASPAKMQEVKLYRGLTYQNKDTSDTTIRAEVQCVDDSLNYADVPLCYELGPFSGKRRGQIVKELAAMVGIDPATVTVPIGGVVNKPILLSNGSLLPFIADFGLGENWFPYFDENGRLVVIDVEMKDIPDWTLDAMLGDYDLEQIEETPPVRPPTKFYVTAAIPIDPNGPDAGALLIRTVTVEEDVQFYNPKSVKVRPSGAASFLQADGTYRAYPAQILTLVTRLTTEAVTKGGILISKHIAQEGFYNPNTYDSNFNSFPTGTSYDGAYSDKSFHTEEIERFQRLVEELDEYQTDDNGTLLRSVVTLSGWYAPQNRLTFQDAARTQLINYGGYIFAGGTERSVPTEFYGPVKRVETDYSYGADGAIARKTERTFKWFTPQSRSDIIVTTTIPDTGPTPPPTPSLPAPGFPPPPAPPPQPAPQEVPPGRPPVNSPPVPAPPPGQPAAAPVVVNLSGGTPDFFGNYVLGVSLSGGSPGVTATFAGQADVLGSFNYADERGEATGPGGTDIGADDPDVDDVLGTTMPVTVYPQTGTFSPSITVPVPGAFTIKIRPLPPLGAGILLLQELVRVSVTLNGGGYSGVKAYSRQLDLTLPSRGLGG